MLRVVVGAVLVAVVVAWVHWGLASLNPSAAVAPGDTTQRAITVHAVGATALTRDVLDTVSGLDGVAGVFPRATARVHAARAGLGPVEARSYDPTLAPADVEPRAGELLLPASFDGADLTSLVGRSVEIEYAAGASLDSTTRTVAAVYGSGAGPAVPTVIAPFDDVASWQAARLGLTVDGMLQTLGADGVTVLAESTADVQRVLRGLSDLGLTAARAADPAGRAATAALDRVPLAPVTVVVVLLLLTALAAGLSARTREVGLAVVVGCVIGVAVLAARTAPDVVVGRVGLAVALTAATCVVSARIGSALGSRPVVADAARAG